MTRRRYEGYPRIVTTQDKSPPLNMPELPQAHVALLRYDDMVEHPDTEDRSGLDELPGDADVLGRRLKRP